MPCPEYVLIGQDLIFSVAIHDPDNGDLYDATPSYKVYEESTNTQVDSGTMSKIDSGETGFYSEALTCDSETYEDGKAYLICIKGTVDTATGGIIYRFRAFDEIQSNIGWPIVIQGYDALAGRQVQIQGRYL